MDLSNIIFMDWETQSAVPITEGTYRYAAGSRPLMAQYARGDGEVKVWLPQEQPIPTDLHEYLLDPKFELAFHNVEFDRTNMIAWGYHQTYNMDARRFLCTMTLARMCRLPGGLDDLCKALGVPEAYAKKDGAKLIRTFCIPNAEGSFGTSLTHPAEWQSFIEYGVADIIAMRECYKRMPSWVFSSIERDLYAYTQVMNDRGIGIDRELAIAAMVQSDALKDKYKRRGKDVAVAAVTEALGSDEQIQDAGELNIASQKAVLQFLSSFGVTLEDARSATIEKFLVSSLAEMLPENVRELLATRLKANKASVAKYSAVLKSVSSDQRLRGLINFYGAGTGRDAGRKFQIQNLARPVYVGEKFKNLSMEEACGIVKAGSAEMYFESPMQLFSDCVRGVLVPRPGRKFVVSDLSSIEGRVLPWLAREDWKVNYYADLDAGRVKYDGYQLAYAKAFGVDPSTVTKAQRTLGKPIELSTGYQGGVGALITFAVLYHIDLDDMARKAREAADVSLWTECDKSYEWYLEKGLTYGLPQDTFTGCLYIVKAWRNNHPQIVALWKSCETAFRNAIENPGVHFEAGRGTYFINMNGWVFAQLPSGRALVYPNAHITDSKKCAYTGVNPFTRKWSTILTYGGKLTENLTQAVARDVLFWNIPKVEAAGYPILTRVHDEVITEPPKDDRFTAEGLSAILASPHSWCADLPLNAAGVELTRYQK